MAKKAKSAPASIDTPVDGFVKLDPVTPVPAVGADEGPAILLLQAGPNASDGSFGMRISDEIRLDIARGQTVEVPAMLEYEAVCKQRGPNLGKRITKKVDVAWLLAKAFRFGLVEWVNRPPAPPRQSRVQN